MRLSDLFDLVLASIKKNKYDISNISKRIIKIENNNNLNYFDLEMFYANGDYSNNPYINRTDDIEFFLVDSYVEIWGGVVKPGKYELLDDNRLNDIIKLTGGLFENALSDSLIVTRIINNKREHLIVNLTLEKDFLLYDNDIINIKNKDENLSKQTAFISGEVNFPGLYNIDNSITSIDDLISLAGGFSNQANQKIVMIENQVEGGLDLNNIINKPKEYITESDVSFVDVGLDYHLNSKSIINNKEFAEYKLMNGDEVSVLPKVNFIEIVGAINRPGKYPYNENFTISDYIKLAGGKKKNSLNSTYVVEQGSILKKVAKTNQILNGGDIIFIPYDLEVNRWTKFKDWMTVSGQVAAFVVLIQNIVGNGK